VAVLIFAMRMSASMRETSAALDLVDQRGPRLTGHLERIQRATHEAASDLAPADT
jgi:hypothetical protein